MDKSPPKSGSRISNILHYLPLLRFLLSAERFIVRVYTLAILLVVLWAGYLAGVYLVKSVFWGFQSPQKYVKWQATVTADSLWKAKSPPPPPPRAPLSHYHTMNQQFLLDRYNGCTASNCHSPIPHRKSQAMRSFSNFHATFLACQTCHAPEESKPMHAAWVSTATGKIQPPPAILTLLRHLETEKQIIQTKPAVLGDTITDLLKESIKVAGQDPLLHYLMLQIDTSEPGSPVWRHAIEQLTEELPLHLRGQYGAKITPLPMAQNERSINRDLVTLASRYDAAGNDRAARTEVFKSIHDPLKKPALCLDCHTAQSSLVDFGSLGYSTYRAGLLSGNAIAQQVQHIQQGKPFYLPSFLEGGK